MTLLAVQIIELDPATAPAADLAGWHDVLCAAWSHDLPDDPLPVLADTVARLRHPFSIARRVHWLARVDGMTAATCELKLDGAPNQDIGDISLSVAPNFRRRGIGRALLGEAARRLADEGRPTVTAEVVAGTAGEPFARAHGFSCALTERRGILRLADVDGADLDDLVAAVPAGYRLARWLTRVPDGWVESFVRAKESMADAPTGDLSWRPLELDTAKWRDIEDVLARRGQEARIVVAIHEPSGVVAGLTELTYSRLTPRRATQEDTIVVPAHRGRRLGLAIKADMLHWIRAECPQIREIETWNAESNSHMLAINDRLGSRREQGWSEYQADVATVRAACSRMTPAAG